MPHVDYDLIGEYSQSYPLPRGVAYGTDKNSCFSDGIAYVMYRLQAPEALWQPRNIDALTGRKPGEVTTEADAAYFALLDQGAKLTSIRDFTDSRFVSEGMPYLEANQAAWLQSDPKSFYEYWTRERVERQQSLAEQFMTKAKNYGPQWSEFERAPQDEDFRQNLVGGMIMCLLQGDTADTSHAVVAHGYGTSEDDDDYEFITYFDDGHTPPLRWTDIETFTDYHLLKENGIVVIEPSVELEV